MLVPVPESPCRTHLLVTVRGGTSWVVQCELCGRAWRRGCGAPGSAADQLVAQVRDEPPLVSPTDERRAGLIRELADALRALRATGFLDRS